MTYQNALPSSLQVTERGEITSLLVGGENNKKCKDIIVFLIHFKNFLQLNSLIR